ncbi:VWFA domain-containing protein [Vibrio crassostreae]|nr:VWFA domain-containing protein [Vibrio crassostreae]
MDMTTLNLGGALALGQRIVISVDGTIKVLEEGQPLQAGDVVLESQNGSNEPQVSAKRFSSEEGEIELDQDIANIFAALEEGQDPTELGEEFATAAGQNGSSLASSGTIERDGEETIPGTEFVTTGFEALGMSRTQSLSLLDAFRSVEQPNNEPTFVDNSNSPVGDTVSFTTNEDTPINGTLSASDEDGDSLSFTKATDPLNGSVVVDDSGDWTYTPNENYNGDDSFTVVVSDGQGGTDTITVNIGVAPVNDAPVGNDVSVTTDEDTPVSGTLNATDADGDSLTFTKDTDPSNGSVVVDENGNWTYTPDKNYSGSDSFTVVISDGEGGTEIVTVDVGVMPVIDTTTVSLSADASVTEGESITYTATLTNPADGAVTVTLSNGATITIADGATSGTTTVPASDDVYVGGDTASATITDATGGNFESLVKDPTAATTTINDDSDVTTVSLSADASVTEGENITYTATLTNPADGAVSNGATITIADGATSGTTTVPASDDVYVGGDTASATITDATGGNFESLVKDPTAATTTINDDSDVTTVSLSADASVTEGENITYTATLTNPADGAVTVTLSNGATITIADGATSGTTTVPASDDVYVGGDTASATITDATGGNFESLVKDPTAATTTINDDSDVTTVSLSADASVTEGESITYTATLTNPADGAVTVTLSNGATITIADGATSGTTTVPASDDVYVGGDTASATITDATGGNFESLVKDPTAATTTINDDSDVTTVSLQDIYVNEGSEATIIGTLDHTPETELVVTLDNGSTITFGTDYVAGDEVTSTPFTVLDDLILTVASTSGGNFEVLDTTDSAQVNMNDAPEADDFTETTVDCATSVNFAPRTSDEEDDAAGVETSVIVESDPVFGTLYEVADDGTKTEVVIGQEYGDADNFEYVVDSDIAEQLTFSASELASSIDTSNGSTSISYFNDLISITAGKYTGSSPVGNDVVNNPGVYLNYDGDGVEDGFGVSTSKNGNSELDVTSKEFISVDFSNSGAEILSANLDFGSVYGNYNANSSADGEINVVALDAAGNVVGTFNFNTENGSNSGDEYTLSIDGSGNATVNVSIPDGNGSFIPFTELRVFTTQDGSSNPNRNSNITFKGVDVVDAKVTETIDYKAEDSSDLESSTAQVTIETDSIVKPSPEVTSVSRDVSEDASTTQTVSGNVDVLYAESITLQEPSENYTSGGQSITWVSSNGGQTLVGSANGVAIVTATIDDSGNYSVSLSGPIDHLNGSTPVDDMSIDIGVVATNDTGTQSGTISLTIDDDVPVAQAKVHELAPEVKDGANVQLILDVSGSMSGNAMTVMKQSAIALLQGYQLLGETKVQITVFESDANVVNENGSWSSDNSLPSDLSTIWMDVDTAIGAITSLTAGGGTDYDDAVWLAGSDSIWGNSDMVSGGSNISYFLSDGDPSSTNHRINPSEQAAWESQLTKYGVTSLAYGMGSNISSEHMEPVAFDGDKGIDISPVIVSDISQLPPVLLQSIITPVSGNIGASGSAGNSFGADGGYIQSIVFDGVTYQFDGSTLINPQSQSSSNHSFDDSNNTLSLFINNEHSFVINLETGDYEFYGSSVAADTSFDFAYTIADNDGDTSSSTIQINIASTSLSPIADVKSEGDIVDSVQVVHAGTQYAFTQWAPSGQVPTTFNLDQTQSGLVVDVGAAGDDVYLGSGDDTIYLGDSHATGLDNDASHQEKLANAQSLLDDVFSKGSDSSHLQGGLESGGFTTLAASSNAYVDLGTVVAVTMQFMAKAA